MSELENDLLYHLVRLDATLDALQTRSLRQILLFLLNNNLNTNWYIHTGRNAKVTSARNVYEKTVMKRKNKCLQRRIYNPLEHLQWSFFKKIVSGVTGYCRYVVKVANWILITPLVLITAKKTNKSNICIRKKPLRAVRWQT